MSSTKRRRLLTTRQIQLLKLAQAGCKTSVIARELGIREGTVLAKLRDINRGAQRAIHEIASELDTPLFQEDGHHGSY
ncbi:response regulator transcription factor [Acidithiobacillus ferrooxidans]|jgi:transcriptional regulator|uniref:LuxR C-terminal-related transcriptional regulator n=1 Tax=Acidithiobacillus ferrooxidans TaxID=920 RepID=UPI001C07C52C|nr:LuxR C-terminal-related transcriptional regulator [Acidithiobacillus ferrooxidans]MBU2858192.1 response regulator transcription factor [Acidithiobacillus ferrooxidans]MDA8180751.1 LuxR C-terminal-related transcriptional regulator [Acidithiobacillus sp.]